MFEMILPYAEHIITLTLGLCVFLAARNHIANWPIGLVGVTMYGLAAYHLWGLYADAYLQIFYFATGVIGWAYWLKGGKDRNQAPVMDLPIEIKTGIMIAILMATAYVGDYIVKATDSVVPYLDAFTTVTCLVAQILLMARCRFNWVLWIIADVVYVYMFYVKGLNLLSIEYALFTVNAVYGYSVWTKQLRKGAV